MNSNASRATNLTKKSVFKKPGGRRVSKVKKHHASDTVASFSKFRTEQRSQFNGEVKDVNFPMDMEAFLEEHDKKLNDGGDQSENISIADVASKSAKSMVSQAGSEIFKYRIDRILKNSLNSDSKNQLFHQENLALISSLAVICSDLGVSESPSSYFTILMKLIDQTLENTNEAEIAESLTSNLYVAKLLLRSLNFEILSQKSQEFLKTLSKLEQFIGFGQKSEHEFLYVSSIILSSCQNTFLDQKREFCTNFVLRVIRHVVEGDSNLGSQIVKTLLSSEFKHGISSHLVTKIASEAIIEHLNSESAKTKDILQFIHTIQSSICFFSIKRVKEFSEAILKHFSMKQTKFTETILDYFLMLFKTFHANSSNQNHDKFFVELSNFLLNLFVTLDKELPSKKYFQTVCEIFEFLSANFPNHFLVTFEKNFKPLITLNNLSGPFVTDMNARFKRIAKNLNSTLNVVRKSEKTVKSCLEIVEKELDKDFSKDTKILLLNFLSLFILSLPQNESLAAVERDIERALQCIENERLMTNLVTQKIVSCFAKFLPANELLAKFKIVSADSALNFNRLWVFEFLVTILPEKLEISYFETNILPILNKFDEMDPNTFDAVKIKQDIWVMYQNFCANSVINVQNMQIIKYLIDNFLFSQSKAAISCLFGFRKIFQKIDRELNTDESLIIDNITAIISNFVLTGNYQTVENEKIGLNIAVLETLKLIISKYKPTKVHQVIEHLLIEAEKALDEKSIENLICIFDLVDAHLHYSLQFFPKLEELTIHALTSDSVKLHKKSFDILQTLYSTIANNQQNIEVLNDIQAKLLKLFSIANQRTKAIQNRCLTHFCESIIKWCDKTEFLKWISPFVAQIMLSFNTISAKSCLYSKKLFTMIIATVFDIDSTPGGLSFQFFDMLIQAGMTNGKSRSSALHSINYLLELYPQASTIELHENIHKLLADRSDSMYTVPDLVLFSKISQKILRHLKLDLNAAERISSIMFSLDPLAAKNCSSSYLRLIKILSQQKGDKFLDENVPRDFFFLVKKFRKSQAKKDANDESEMSTIAPSTTKEYQNSKYTKLSRKTVRKMRENENSDEEEEIVDLLDVRNDESQNDFEINNVVEEDDEKINFAKNISGKIIVNEEKGHQKKVSFGEINDARSMQNGDDRMSTKSKKSKLSKMSKVSIGSEFRSRKGHKSDINPKGSNSHPCAVVKFDKKLLTHKKKVVKGAFNDLFTK